MAKIVNVALVMVGLVAGLVGGVILGVSSDPGDKTAKIESLKQRVQEVEKLHEESKAFFNTFFMQEVETAKELATDIYPDVSREDSALVKTMVEMDSEWKEADNPLYYSSTKPMLLAHLAAGKLGVCSDGQTVQRLRDQLAESTASYDRLASQFEEAKDLASRERERMAKQIEEDRRRQLVLAEEREQLAREREQLAKEKGALAQQQAATQSTQAGFNAFVEEQQNLSGPRQIKGGSSKGGARYSQGPWKGKTQGEGMEMAIRQWEAMSTQQRMAYERRTTLYGSTHQYRQDSLSPNSDQGQYISNTGQMMPSPENFSGPRTVLMNGRSYMVQENGNTTVITGTRPGESFTATQNGNTTVITGGRSGLLDR